MKKVLLIFLIMLLIGFGFSLFVLQNTCTNEGHKMLDGWSYCPYDGEILSGIKMHECKYKNIDAPQRYCGVCGKRIGFSIFDEENQEP